LLTSTSGGFGDRSGLGDAAGKQQGPKVNQFDRNYRNFFLLRSLNLLIFFISTSVWMA
jgi:hypothetical protein